VTAGRVVAPGLRGRKVRSPQGSVPANGRGSGNGPRKVPQKIYRRDRQAAVRVKWCGKSAPRRKRFRWQGKPHVEQDQIGEEGRPVPLLLPGRSLEPDRNVRPRGMTTARKGTETGLQSGSRKREFRSQKTEFRMAETPASVSDFCIPMFNPSRLRLRPARCSAFLSAIVRSGPDTGRSQG